MQMPAELAEIIALHREMFEGYSMSTDPQAVFAAEVGEQQVVAEQSDQVRAAAVEAANQQGRTFTEADVAAIRKQEKDKLYKQLEEREADLAALKADLAKRQAAEQEEQARIQAEQEKAAEAARKAEEERMTWQERLAQQEAEVNARFAALEEERAAQAALQEKERQLAELEQYRHDAIQNAQEDIVPELLDLVTGNTAEEIDASVESLKERSARIFESVTAARQEQQRQQVGARITSPGVGPMEINTENRQYSAADIAAMPMNEWAQVRQGLVGKNPTDRGMFR